MRVYSECVLVMNDDVDDDDDDDVEPKAIVPARGG